MKLLSWNCQGICNTSTVQALKAQIKGVRPNLIFLSETRALVSRMDFVRSSISFDNMLVVKASGKASGLCVMWKEGISVREVEYNKNLIAITVSDFVCEWLMVRFYGPPYFSKKKKAWENIMALLESHQGPWMCIGDFNYVISEDEVSGGRKGCSLATNYLKELMFEFEAIDLGFLGSKFTWAKGGWGNASIKRRLDRGITNMS